MDRKGIFTKILAVAGTMIVWLPIIAPILLSVATAARRPRFTFDYLMPAELFPAALVGGSALVWAAWRARSRQKLVTWSLVAALVSLVGSQALAVVTGLAAGKIEPKGLWWALVLALLALYSLAVIAAGIGGMLLLRDLFGPACPRRMRKPTGSKRI